ncbi:MAG: glutathione S-transferase family protein [Gammaproteobacteria bacterium]
MEFKEIILFHSNWSLCSQMVRVALYEKGIPFKEKHIKLCDQYPEGENLDKSFLDINPLGTVPAIKINERVVCDSAVIIKELNSFQGSKQINLYNNDDNDSDYLISETTITEGVKFASTLGTILPVFSAPLIQYMVKKLPFKSILKILLRHPRNDRKLIFLSMYFLNFSKNLPKIGVKKFASELLNFENRLSKDNKYFYKTFSHIDINMMCLFNRLKDLQLENCLITDKTPLIKRYWNHLQERNSYEDGILNYYTEKEFSIIKDFYQNKSSIFVNHIIEELDLL